jgi:L-seryl-tRNA(Ser) seleniumtransferase
LGGKYHIPVMEDLGSGTLIDFSAYGLRKEPTVQEALAAGTDVVTFSGDKLLGGPQAGVIVGKQAIVEKIKQNPLTRALRIDKLTLAALESTLHLYRNPAVALDAIPTLRMLTLPLAAIEARANQLVKALVDRHPGLMDISVLDLSSRVGGGALPLLELPSKCVGIKTASFSANAIDRFMRTQSPAIIGRIESDRFVMDPRTIADDEVPVIRDAFQRLINGAGS